MAELLWTAAQSVCLAGYLYGAWIVITHAVIDGSRRAQPRWKLMQQADGDESAAWHRYLTYDS